MKRLRRFFRNLQSNFETYSFVKALYYSFIYPVQSNLEDHLHKLSRSFSYARFGYNNYDFDCAYLWDLMGFKLKRIENCLLNGHLDLYRRKPDLKALKEMIKCCERLHEEEYEDTQFKAHDKKWGKRPRPKFIKTETLIAGKPTYKMVVKNRSKVKTPKQVKEERADFRRAIELAEAYRVADIQILGALLAKHSHNLWD